VMVAYNLSFIQPQGRYLFPASAAIGVFFALGLREVIDRPRLLATLVVLGCAALYVLASGKLFVVIGGAVAVVVLGLWVLARHWYRSCMWLGLVGALVVLDIVCLVRFIVPALAV